MALQTWHYAISGLTLALLLCTLVIGLVALQRDVPYLLKQNGDDGGVGQQPLQQGAAAAAGAADRATTTHTRIHPGPGISVSSANVVSLAPIPAHSVLANVSEFPGPPVPLLGGQPGSVLVGGTLTHLPPGAPGSIMSGAGVGGGGATPAWTSLPPFAAPRGGASAGASFSFLDPTLAGLSAGSGLACSFGASGQMPPGGGGVLEVPFSYSLDVVLAAAGTGRVLAVLDVTGLIPPTYELKVLPLALGVTGTGWLYDPTEATPDVPVFSSVSNNNSTSELLLIVGRMDAGALAIGRQITAFGTGSLTLVPV